MATPQFRKASKKEVKLKMAIDGPTKSGKSITGLRMIHAITKDPRKRAVIDSERGRIELYVGEENPDGGRFDFDVLVLEDYSVESYLGALQAAIDAGYEAVMIDQISHEWAGQGGILSEVDQAKKFGGKSEKGMSAWIDATPKHQSFLETLIQAKVHLVCTMRSKMAYAMETETVNGKEKTVVRKLGLAPVQRDGIEYEFDVQGSMDENHVMRITGTRCRPLEGKSFHLPGAEVAEILMRWLADGAIPLTQQLREESDAIREKIAPLANEIQERWEVEGWKEKTFMPHVTKCGDDPKALANILKLLDDKRKKMQDDELLHGTSPKKKEAEDKEKAQAAAKQAAPQNKVTTATTPAS